MGRYQHNKFIQNIRRKIMGTWHVDKDRLKKILTKPIKNKASAKK